MSGPTIALAARTAMLDGFEVFMLLGAGTANLTLYQTNTALCVFPLNAVPFGAAVVDSLVLASTPISSTGTEVAGTANRFIVTNQNGDTGLSGTVSAIGGGGHIETPNTTVTAAATQTLNALVLRLAADGALTIEGSLTLQ
jgi:hypothetical protein